MYMHKIGVIGDKDTVLGFKALGLHVFPVNDNKQASLLVNRLAKEEFAVLFITEKIASGIKETLDRYKTVPFPSIIPIPNNQGSTGLGIKGVKESVEKAIGSDILFGEGR